MYELTGTAMVLAGALGLAAPATAQTARGLEVALDISDYSYEEDYEGDIVEDDGTLFGARLGYTAGLGQRFFVRGLLDAAFGSIDYSASEGTSRIEGVRQTVTALELHGGLDVPVGEGVSLSPYIGLGSRMLADRSGGLTATDGLLGYDRDVTYLYMPIGSELGFAGRGGARFALTAQYNWVVGGDAESKFSGLDPSLPDVEVELNEGDGFEIAFEAALPVRGGRSAITVSPYWRHWNIGESERLQIEDSDEDEIFELFEPKNDSSRLGIRLGFQF